MFQSSRCGHLVLWTILPLSCLGSGSRVLAGESSLTQRAASPQPSSQDEALPDGKTLAAGGNEKVVYLWEVSTGAELMRLQGHTERIRSIAISSDGKRLASAGDDRVILVWDSATGKQTHQLRGHKKTIEWVT